MPDRGANIRQNVVEVVRGDVIISSMTHDPSCHVECVRKHTSALEPLKIHVQEYRTTEQLAAVFHGTPLWRRIVAQYNNSGRCVWAGVRVECSDLQAGNSAFAPLIGGASRFTLHLLELWKRGYDLMVESEAHARGGVPYSRVVRTRMENRWLSPHPPLSVLGERIQAWIPSGEDYYNGWNDRHAVLTRAAADVDLNRWKYAMVDENVVSHLRGGMRANPENYLRVVYSVHDIHPGRFPNLMYLSCCKDSAQVPCYTGWCVHRKLVTSPNGVSSVRCKMPGECTSAVWNTMLLGLCGGTYTNRSPTDVVLTTVVPCNTSRWYEYIRGKKTSVTDLVMPQSTPHWRGPHLRS